MQRLQVWARSVLTRVLFKKGLSLFIKSCDQARISAFFSLVDIVPLSDNSLARLAHTISKSVL